MFFLVFRKDLAHCSAITFENLFRLFKKSEFTHVYQETLLELIDLKFSFLWKIIVYQPILWTLISCIRQINNTNKNNYYNQIYPETDFFSFIDKALYFYVSELNVVIQKIRISTAQVFQRKKQEKALFIKLSTFYKIKHFFK